VGEHKGDSPEEENPGIPSTSENSNAESSEVDWVIALILVSTLALFFWLWLMRASCCA
jgi:hypothetical protein